MTEYKVHSTESDGIGEMARICNEMAAKGWRLVSTTAFTRGAHLPRMYFFFAREAGEKREPQQAWAAQHRGED